MKYIAILLLGFLSVGCTTVHFYSGPEKSNTELALVISQLTTAHVISIDAKKNTYNPGTYNHFYVEPGYHEFVVKAAWETYMAVGFYDQTSDIYKKVCFSFEKGKEYSVGATKPDREGGWELRLWEVIPKDGWGSDYIRKSEQCK